MQSEHKMKLFENCLIACDIDGTLMVNGIIPQVNKEKISFFMENGGDFAIATGRSLCAVSDVFEQLGEVSLGTYANGTVIYDRKTARFLFEARLDESEYEIMYKVMDRFSDAGIEVHFQDKMGVYNETEETELHVKYEKMVPVALEKENLKTISTNKILYLLPSFEKMKEVKAFVQTLPTKSDFVETTVTYYGKQRFFVEQIPAGVSKSTGVIKLGELLGTKKGCLYAIGDYYNDLEMLSAADLSAVPAESPEEIKKNAAYITRSAENGAVADFIDYLTKMRSR